MITIDLNNCSSEVHFPVVQAVPNTSHKNFFKRFFKFITYRRKFQVMEDYCLWAPFLAVWIFIPKGFIYDGASIPKLLNNLYSPTGMLLLGAAPHDFGYRYEGLLQVDYKGRVDFFSYTKKQLDEIFKHLCTYESGMAKASSLATFTLGFAGFLGWNENRKLDCKLKEDFPELFLPDLKEKTNEVVR